MGKREAKKVVVPVEVYSRVVGYYRPVDQWNKGKQAEFGERREYNVQAAINKAKNIGSV